MAALDAFVSALLPAQDPQGRHIMAALVKRTYEIGPDGRCTPAAEQDPLVGADRYYDGRDPVTAACEFESDYIPYKLATDVVVNATAHAPGGRPVKSLEVAVSIAGVTKRILVIGDRHCSFARSGHPLFSEPEPFATMPIRYERAYGGVDVASSGPDAPMIYPRNHLGKGFVVANVRASIEGLELPNLEDPGQPLRPETLVGPMEQWQQRPLPQGFGWYGKLWYPRCSFAGVMPAYMSMYDELREAFLGLVPRDQVEQFKKFKLPLLDFQYFNGASPGLALPDLKGDETIRMVHLDPRGDFTLKLPGAPPRIGIDLGDSPRYPEVVLQTVCVLKEAGRVYLVWRGAVGYPGPEKLDAIKRMDVLVEEG